MPSRSMNGEISGSPRAKICRYDGRAFELFNSRKESDGLFYANATRARDGRLVSGGKSGIHVFDPEKIRNDTIRPRVYLTGFKVLNKVHGLGKFLNWCRKSGCHSNLKYSTLNSPPFISFAPMM